MNGWIEEDVPLGVDLMEPKVDPVIDDMMEPMENPDEDVDMLMDGDDEDDDDEGEDDEDGWEVNEEWLMAPVMPPPMPVVPVPKAFEVGGSSTVVHGPPFPMGRPFLEVVSSVAVHYEEIGGLCVQIENLEHAHGVLVRKIGDVSDAQLDDGIAIGEIQPRVTTLEGQVEVLASQQEQAMTKTLESIVQELRKENQKLRGLLSEKESDYSMLASYVLRLGERLAAMELQLLGPPQGP
ncbi:hypothetical protein Tco_1425627 [Tanacetum coccineum]